MTYRQYLQHRVQIVRAWDAAWNRGDLVAYEIEWARFELLQAYARRRGWYF